MVLTARELQRVSNHNRIREVNASLTSTKIVALPRRGYCQLIRDRRFRGTFSNLLRTRCEFIFTRRRFRRSRIRFGFRGASRRVINDAWLSLSFSVGVGQPPIRLCVSFREALAPIFRLCDRDASARREYCKSRNSASRNSLTVNDSRSHPWPGEVPRFTKDSAFAKC